MRHTKPSISFAFIDSYESVRAVSTSWRLPKATSLLESSHMRRSKSVVRSTGGAELLLSSLSKVLLRRLRKAFFWRVLQYSPFSVFFRLAISFGSETEIGPTARASSCSLVCCISFASREAKSWSGATAKAAKPPKDGRLDSIVCMQRPRFRLLLRAKEQEEPTDLLFAPASARSGSAYRRRTLVLEPTLGLDRPAGLVNTSKLLRAHTGLPKGIKFTPMSSAGRHLFVPYFQHQMQRSLRTLQRQSSPVPLLGHQSPLLRRALRDRDTPSSTSPRPLSRGPY